MAVEIKAPSFPESVQEGTLASWHKSAGDQVSRDELIVEIETDKVGLEVVAPANGVLLEILKQEGDVIQSNELLARIEEGATTASTAANTSDATPSAGQVAATASSDDAAAIIHLGEASCCRVHACIGGGGGTVCDSTSIGTRAGA